MNCVAGYRTPLYGRVGWGAKPLQRRERCLASRSATALGAGNQADRPRDMLVEGSEFGH